MARRIPWLAVGLGVLPWTWYLLRDVSGRMDIVALTWPVFGTLAVAGFAVLALVLRSRPLVAVAVSWVVCLLAVVVGPWRPLDTGSVRGGGAVRILAANLHGSSTYPPGMVHTFRQQQADIAVLSEVELPAERTYRAAYRYEIPRKEDFDDVAVYGNLPMRDLGMPLELADQRGKRVEVEGPDGPFVLLALHLQKPGPDAHSYEVGFRSHRRLIERVVKAVRAERLPVVVAGDLNLADRTTGYRDLAGALDDAMRAGWVGPTSIKRDTRLLLARIDHIFMPSDWCSDRAHTFSLLGSDHRGVVATVGTCR